MRLAEYSFYAMGSDCTVHLYGETGQDLDPFFSAAEAEVRRIERRYSRYRADSELSRINVAAASGDCVLVDDETAALIVYAKTCFEKSDGAFDITSGLLRKAWDFSVPRVPDQQEIDGLLHRIGLEHVSLSGNFLNFSRRGMEIDFGGLGKEYAADRAAEVCATLGAASGFVDLAGDIRIIGPQPDGQPWRIGIRHPRDPGGVAAEVSLMAGALATSGDYERYIEASGRRYCHILDPRTGWPAEGLSSVTVVTDRCLVAGSPATSAMIKGEQGGNWLKGLGVRYIAIDGNGRVQG
jgi:thiamine biosynthesis lipoprotein